MSEPTARFTEKQWEVWKEAICAGARHVFLYGGSRSGKTFLFVFAIVYRAWKCPGSRHVILRKHLATLRRALMMDTFPKVMQVAFPNFKYEMNKGSNFVTFKNGSELWFCGLDDKERADKVLGAEYATVFFNEASELTFDAVQTALTRLAQKTDLENRAYYDCNPPSKRHWLYKLFFDGLNPETNEPMRLDHVKMKVNPHDNAENLPEGYIDETLSNLSRRQRLRFLKGEWLDDDERALWKRKDIDDNRVPVAPRQLNRIVIGVDPAVTANQNSDETGIVVVGMDHRDPPHVYVLDDRSLVAKPEQWGQTVVDVYNDFFADRVIAEVNNGGDLVERNLRIINPNIPVEMVRATKGKAVRAEPVEALYEQGRVHHVGALTKLEDQMCEWVPGETSPGLKSPDRVDALVWAVTKLLGLDGKDKRAGLW